MNICIDIVDSRISVFTLSDISRKTIALLKLAGRISASASQLFYPVKPGQDPENAQKAIAFDRFETMAFCTDRTFAKCRNVRRQREIKQIRNHN